MLEHVDKSIIDLFFARYKITDKVVFVPYGSHVYGTDSASSDRDYIAVVETSDESLNGQEFRSSDVDIQIYTASHLQNQLDLHKISAMEIFFLNDDLPGFQFKLHLPTLRSSLSQKASHSFVKAKKNIYKEKDFYIGFKSLFHALRILEYGHQIAVHGKIVDYSAANHFWEELKSPVSYEWSYYKEKYQPIYNEMATRFRAVAPKE